MGFGPHLTIDGISSDKKSLANMTHIYSFLDQCPKKIDMTKITEPYIVKVDHGFTGMVLIAESHISVHTYPKTGKVFIDIFSCKPFDISKALKYAAKYFKLKDFQSECIQRGKEFPRWK